MGTFSSLATAAAETVAEGGLELNLDILETNLVNLVIIIGVLVVFGRRFLGKMLGDRRSRIEQELTEAEKRAQEAETALAQAQQNLAQAQAEVERIRKSAEESAQKVKERILAENTREIERIKTTAVQDLDAQTERAIDEIRQRVATLALERVEVQLKERLQDQGIQRQLIDRSLAQLGGDGR